MKKLVHGIVFAAATMAAGAATAGVTFFERENFQGMPLSTNGAIPDFRAYDFNDRTMSMVVQGDPVEVCVDIHFSGNCQVFAAGEYPSLIGLGWAGAISSVRPAGAIGFGQGGYDPRGYQGSYDQRRYQGGYDPRYQQGGYDQRGYDYSQRRRDGYYDPRYNRGY